MSTRQLLRNHYVQVDRSKKPYCFLLAKEPEYNDILNNYRIPLGEYQFKRTLFAREWLYKDVWHEMVSFAFCREPLSRCISAFFYLWEAEAQRRAWLPSFNGALNAHGYGLDYSFDQFLDAVVACRDSGSNFSPMGLHFSTHTATMWDDVTDSGGSILLSNIFRLEDLIHGINHVFSVCGVPDKAKPLLRDINTNETKRPFTPSRHHIAKVEDLYGKDFELYETYGRLF
ncbi:hypothetical protein Avi_9606 (plasmid) [Allorhizobium ampelinum S4]|uniref:Sulfotransferase family protein n=2 Tax=Allorhizobium TaxID=78526 RepID=B9K378_ALLAM|nr:hypothetical protein Avi_9606 [Allorhizobium ampelinum S4]